jgi:tetratricopeptide (TPR) repeat protein
MRNISATLFTCCVVLLIADTISAQRPIRPDPNAERALSQYQKGWQHMRAEQYEDALQAFARALELNPRLNLAHYGKGRAYMGLRRYTEAVQSYSVCRENYIAEAGKKYASQVEATRAQQDRLLELRFLQQQSTSGPQNARSQDQQRQIQDAVRIAENAIQRGINISIDASVPAFVSLALGSAYFRSERMDDAERAYKEALAADSKAGEAHNNLAVIYLLSGRLSEAELSVKAAEKCGFSVNSELKDQIKQAKKTS